VTSSGSGEAHALWTDFRSNTNQDIYCANYNQQPTVTLTGPTYIDAGGSGAYYLINGSQSSSIQVDLGSSIALQAVPQNSTWAFAGWNFGSNSNPVTYYPTDNVSLSANLKELQHSMDASAYSDNSQRKMIQTPNGYLFEAYTEDGHVWVEYSNDNGKTWTLGHGGTPLDDGQGKCPSIDYWGNQNDAVILVAFQQQEGSYYSIQLETFEYNTTTGTYDYRITPELLYTESADTYSSTNANPNIAAGNGGYFLVTFERKSTSGGEPGINLIGGQIDGQGSITAGPAQFGNLTGTDNTCVNASIYANKSASIGAFPVVWEKDVSTSSKLIMFDGVYMTYSSGAWQISQSTPQQISNSAYKLNYHPSIVQMADNTARVCWIGDAAGNGKPLTVNTIYWKQTAPSQYATFGMGAQSTSINVTADGNSCFAWSTVLSGAWDNWASAGSGITQITTSGKDVQISNGATKSNLYVSAFYPFSSPYYFSTSTDNLGGLSKSAPIPTAYGRGGTINDGSLNFYYSLGDLMLDGNSIGFIPSSDRVDYDSLDNLNNSLVTEPFQVTGSTKIVFSDYCGFADSTAAAVALGGSGYIENKAEVVDNSTGEALGTIKDVKFTSSNVSGYSSGDYLLSDDGIANKTVKVKIDVSTNLEEPKFALINSYSQVDTSSTENLQSLSLEPITVIKDFTLSQNYPNPFNPTTVIEYTIPKDSHVTLKIYDVLGQEVETLVNEDQNVGRYEVQFNGSRLASGVYFYRLVAGNHVITKKMLELK
jgi:Secretion system C-terminal sorting domain